MDNTKVCGNNTIDLTDTKEDIHWTKRSESYDAETDDEPIMTTRSDSNVFSIVLELHYRTKASMCNALSFQDLADQNLIVK